MNFPLAPHTLSLTLDRKFPLIQPGNTSQAIERRQHIRKAVFPDLALFQVK